MKTGTKFTWGLILNLAGAVLFCVGFAISFTIIGACLGLPMIAVGFPLLIWGAVWIYKARADKAREIIARGIQEGLSRFELPAASSGPSNSISSAPPPAPVSLSAPCPPPAKVDSVRVNIPVSRASAEPIAGSRPGRRTEPRDWLKRTLAAAAVFGEGVRDGIVIAVRSLSQRKPAALALALILMTCVAATLGVLLYQQSNRRLAGSTSVREEGPRKASEPSTSTPIAQRSPPVTLATTHRSTPAARPPSLESAWPKAAENQALLASTKIAGAASMNPAISPPPVTPTREPAEFSDPDGENVEEPRQAPPTVTQWPGEQFPETRIRSLSAGEVQGWSFERLQYAINEMFARRGAEFGDKRIAAWFQQFSWYRPIRASTFDEIEAAMPPIERDNLKLLGLLRDARRSSDPVPSISTQPSNRQRANPNFPPTPLGQRLGKFFQAMGDNARNSKPAPRKSPSPTHKRRQ